jgi:succinate dehydrogenase / fumarate reductase membrane anchor subunit
MKASRVWMRQRITSVLLVVLAPLFLWLFLQSFGGSLAEVRATFAQPFAAVASALFLAIGFLHVSQGLHEIIEDYVHGPLHGPTLLAARLACFLTGAAGVLALLKLAFTGGA